MTRSAVSAAINAATASHRGKAELSGFVLLLSGGAIVTVLSPRLPRRCQLAHTLASSRGTPGPRTTGVHCCRKLSSPHPNEGHIWVPAFTGTTHGKRGH